MSPPAQTPQVDVDEVQHPTLGPLKFPKTMPFDERNRMIEQMERAQTQQPMSASERAKPGQPLGMPGSFEGHPENIGEYVPSSFGEMGGGAADIAHGDLVRGAHRIISGGMTAAAPALPFTAVAAPGATALGLGGGYLGSKVGSGLAKTLGAGEDVQNLTGDIGGLVGGGLGIKGANRLGPVMSRAPMAPEEAGRLMTNAFNPPSKQMPKLDVNFGKQIGNVQEFAGREGMPLQNRGQFLEAAGKAGAEREQFYNEKVLGPLKDELVEAPQGFQGQQISTGKTGYGQNRTSLGSMEARLREINNTLSPKYQQGTRAALGAEQTTDLRAEAANIRSALYKGLSDRTGIPVEEIQGLRESFGQLGDISEKGTAALNAERRAANIKARQPLTINPFSAKQRFVLDPLVNAITSPFRATPENVMQRALRTTQPSSPLPTVASPTETFMPPTREPIWQGLNTEGTPVTPELRGPGAQEIQAQVERNALQREAMRRDLERAAMEEASRKNLNLAGRKLGRPKGKTINLPNPFER